MMSLLAKMTVVVVDCSDDDDDEVVVDVVSMTTVGSVVVVVMVVCAIFLFGCCFEGLFFQLCCVLRDDRGILCVVSASLVKIIPLFSRKYLILRFVELFRFKYR